MTVTQWFDMFCTRVHLVSVAMSRDNHVTLTRPTGAADYTKLFVELHLDLLDVLATFPSCQPTLQLLIGETMCNTVCMYTWTQECTVRL